MSFDNYAALQAEIASFLWDRADVVARIPSFIRLAESEARRRLRTRNMNAVEPFVFSGGLAPIPCGSGQIKAVRVLNGSGGTRDLDYVSPERYMAMEAPKSGTPYFYTVQNEAIHFYPTSGASGQIMYVDPFCPLSDRNKSNWLLREYPDIYLCGALKWGKAWLIDSDWDWETPFYRAIEEANAFNPRVQTNTKLRADEVTAIAGMRGFDITTGGLGDGGYVPAPVVPAPAGTPFDFAVIVEE